MRSAWQRDEFTVGGRSEFRIDPNRLHTPRASLMRLSEVFGPSVSPRSRSWGESSFRSGAVQQITSDGGITEATVVGSGSHSVLLQPFDNMIFGSCTCPFFENHREICKHIWATILAAEDKDLLLIPPERVAAEILLEPLVPEDYLDDADTDPAAVDEDDDQDYPTDGGPMRRLSEAARRPPFGQGGTPALGPPREVGAPFPRSTPLRNVPVPRAPPPPWQRLLTSIKNPSHTPTPPPQFAPGQLLYVIDVAATVRDGAWCSI